MQTREEGNICEGEKCFFATLFVLMQEDHPIIGAATARQARW